MTDSPNPHRRQFLTTASLTLAAAGFGFGAIAPARAAITKSSSLPPITPGATTSFAPLRAINAGVLSIAYAEAGPADGPAVILLHGWPYDIYSYADVAPALAAAGYRVILPFARGFGATSFLSAATLRNGQQSAQALDVIALMDALRIEKAVIGGYDWGSRTAAVLAALWPARVKALVAVSGYLITNLAANRNPLPPKAELGWWYQYYFSTERGRLGYEQNRAEFARLIWKIASPKWNFSDATFNRSAAAFNNPDHVAIVIHNYRWRLSLAPGESRYEGFEEKLAHSPAIAVPTITIGSDFDGPNANGAAYAKFFRGKYAHRVLTGIGHDVPQEAPREFAQAIIDADRL